MINIFPPIYLFKTKLAVNWSNGDYDYISKLNKPDNINKTYEYLVGNKKIFVLYYLQIAKVTLMVLFLIATIYEFKNNGNYKQIYISIFGIFIFYMIWEVATRYSLTCLPWIILLIPIGIEKIENWLRINEIQIKYKDNSKQKVYTQKYMKYISITILLLTSILLVVNFEKYCTKKSSYRNMVAAQIGTNGEGNIEDISNSQIEQEFIANRKFNCISVRFLKNKEGQDGIYYFILLDENNNELVRQELDSRDIQKDKYVTFKFDSISPNGNKKYVIKIYPKDEIKQSSIGISSYNGGKNYDIYVNGKLKVDGKEQDKDMTFKVENENKRSYVSKKIYVGLCLLIIILEIYACYPYIKRVGERKKDEQ